MSTKISRGARRHLLAACDRIVVNDRPIADSEVAVALSVFVASMRVIVPQWWIS